MNNILTSILGSQSRAALFQLLFDGRLNEYYLRDIEKKIHIQISALQHEVKHLASLDLITPRKDGNRIYYQANTNHPLYLHLVEIVKITFGYRQILKEQLHHPQIECAFIFGSMANHTEKANSDIDLIIIGDISLKKTVSLLSDVQLRLGREITPHIYTRSEFIKRLKNKNHFLTSVLNSEIQVIIGNINDYR